MIQIFLLSSYYNRLLDTKLEVHASQGYSALRYYPLVR
jgi:hypothetical protein